MLGSSGAYASFPEKILKMWCNLVRFEVYFDQIVYWKNPPKNDIFLYKTYFCIKHIFYVCLSVLRFCPTWGQGCVHPGSVWSKCRCILSFKIIIFQKINSPSMYVVPKVCNILSLLTRVCVTVTTCFCGKKVRTRRREKQKRSRASSNRGLQDTPCTNPEVEAHSRSCSTGVLLGKSFTYFLYNI